MLYLHRIVLLVVPVHGNHLRRHNRFDLSEGEAYQGWEATGHVTLELVIDF